MSLLDVRDLSVSYGNHRALADVSFDVSPGEIVALVGESGSGKSTAALAIMGLLPRGATQQGTISLGATDLGTLNERAWNAVRGREIGMIFQEPMSALNPMMTIGRQVAEVIRLHRGLPWRETQRDAADALAKVGLPASVVPPDRYPHQLSGGQRQRVAIAIAIAAGPRLLIADEPTTALDVTTQAQVIALLAGLVRDEGLGLLLVSHDLALVAETAQRIVVLKDGANVEAGPARDVLGCPQASYTQRLLERAKLNPLRNAPRIAEPLLQVRGLSRTYRSSFSFRSAQKAPAVEDVSFTVHRGESVGIVGESGSGKSTLLRAVLGLDHPDAGEVRIDGRSIVHARGSELRGLRRQVQAVFQDPNGSLDPRNKIERIVAEPLHLLVDPIAAAERRQRVAAVLEEVGLDQSYADRFPHQLSGGQRQRVAIARALIIRPALVVLDEAVTALDVSVRADILELLADLSERLGLAYLFVSHDVGVIRAITDRLLVMQGGRIVEEGNTATVLDAPRHPYTASLVAATPNLDRALLSLSDR